MCDLCCKNKTKNTCFLADFGRFLETKVGTNCELNGGKRRNIFKGKSTIKNAFSVLSIGVTSNAIQKRLGL